MASAITSLINSRALSLLSLSSNALIDKSKVNSPRRVMIITHFLKTRLSVDILIIAMWVQGVKDLFPRAMSRSL